MASVLSAVSYTNLAIVMMIISSSLLQSQAQLYGEHYYSFTCPGAHALIDGLVSSFVATDRSIAAYLIRLHFNDCIVGGCDASLLLDAAGERDAGFNGNLGNSIERIEHIKSVIEKECHEVVSCADIVAMAARAASVVVGGPWWPLKLGRLDSKEPETQDAAYSQHPKSNATLPQLKDLYFSKSFTERDMVAIQGRRTIGKGRCAGFRDRVNGKNLQEIDPEFASEVRESVPCPADGSGDENLRSFDSDKFDIFDNGFYKTLVAKRGLFDSDQTLYSGGSTDVVVEEYVMNPMSFFSDFSAAMAKLSSLNPITDINQGLIREVCSSVVA